LVSDIRLIDQQVQYFGAVRARCGHRGRRRVNFFLQLLILWCSARGLVPECCRPSRGWSPSWGLAWAVLRSAAGARLFKCRDRWLFALVLWL
jgi:hypothetical protein